MLKYIIRLSFAVFLLAFAACSNDDFEMDTSFIESGARAEYTDEVAIQLSTFRLDSVLTANQNRIWTGRFNNKPIIGAVRSRSFLKMSEPSYAWAKKEHYDSVEVVLVHTGEYQGDTTKEITIDIHQLAQPLRLAENETYFYNTRTFRDSVSLGTYTFKPRPHTKPRLNFRLSDEYGMRLANFIKSTENPTAVTSQAFERQWSSFMITCVGDPEAMVAFRADSIQIILHSHISQMTRYKKRRVLRLTEPDKQFNQVWNEGEDEPYKKLREQRRRQVTEEVGGNHAMMYEGLGYYTRINFPSLESVANINRYAHVVRATLTLYAERGSYDKNYIPRSFCLYTTNRYNTLGEQVINNNRGTVYGLLVQNTMDHDEVYYQADLTYYINSRLAQEYIEPTDGLVLTWGAGMEPTNYDFMVFNGHNTQSPKYRSKLDIYYYYYDREDR